MDLYLWAMSILKILFELFVLYLLYKLIFDFIIPVYQTARQVKKKTDEMQNRMNEHIKQQPARDPKENGSRPSKEDYIEFEEVK